MSGNSDVIMGALKLLGKIDCECFTGIPDLLKKIPNLYAVEIPPDITNVILSNTMPDDDQHDCVWFRLNSAGSFVGIFIYQAGDWQQVYPVPQAIFRMYGDSRAVPPGFLLVDSTNPHFTAGEVAAIQATWYPLGGTYFTIFDVTYEGF